MVRGYLDEDCTGPCQPKPLGNLREVHVYANTNYLIKITSYNLI